MKATTQSNSSQEDSQGKSFNKFPVGFAGTGPNGSFFEAPGWVDQKKPPGMTSQNAVVTPPGWWLDYLTGRFLFFSPTLVWLTIALLQYFLLPYDFQAAKSLQNLGWAGYR